MKLTTLLPILGATVVVALALEIRAAEPNRAANTVILEPSAAENLRLEFVEAEETTFEETIFALGEIEVLPGKRAVVSSRIPGRTHSVLVVPHQKVKAGDEVAWVESRQPGDPPPKVVLSAPIDGLVSSVSIALGQPVSPEESLIEIVDLGTMEASAHVPQHLAGGLKPGQKAHIRVPSLPDRVFEAELSHVAVVADGDSATIEAAFHVPNPETLLRPGMKAEFSIVISQREGVMSIPRGAVQGDVAERFVYIKDYELENAFVKTGVVLGAQNDRFVEVVSGLFPGDEVLTRGAYALAFAGKGSVSLKEALDAAHGHPHNEDGTEMSAEQLEAAGHDDHGHEHGQGAGWTLLTTFFAATSGLLLLLLILSLALPRRPAATA
jgi:cobalt-zinc-cadmium efflux system membrane fusion protein